jgi:hypothetical protein
MEAETILQEMHKGTMYDGHDNPDYNIGSDSDHQSGHDIDDNENQDIDGMSVEKNCPLCMGVQ